MAFQEGSFSVQRFSEVPQGPRPRPLSCVDTEAAVPGPEAREAPSPLLSSAPELATASF